MFQFDFISFVLGFVSAAVAIAVIAKLFIYKSKRDIRKLMEEHKLTVVQPSKRKPRLTQKGMVVIELLVYMAVVLIIVFFAFTCHYSIQDLSKAAGFGCQGTTAPTECPLEDGEETGAYPGG